MSIPSRGQSWDDLPRHYNKGQKIIYSSSSTDNNSNNNSNSDISNKSDVIGNSDQITEAGKPLDWEKESRALLKRVMFGITTGGMTGVAFGIVEVMRDVKAVSAKKSVAIAKVVRNTGMFAGFFGAYQGIRRLCYLAYPQPTLDNIAMATLVTMPALLFSKTLRPMLPYGIMLIVLDAYNEVTEKGK
jgi:hypothetical protein